MLTNRLLIAGMSLLVGTVGMAEPAKDPDSRAAATEAQMTDDERFRLLHTESTLWLGADGKLAFGPVKPMAGYAPGIARLGVPPILQTDGGLGVTNPLQTRPGDVATALPSGLALAATFSPELVNRAGALVGAEARAKGFNVLLGGGINLARDPRAGRNFEYFGEDPLLAGILVGEMIRGTQSQKVVATIKHFALNDQETHRHGLNAVINEGELRESDLLAFEIAIERGKPGAVMCGYNRVNGAYSCGSDLLLNRILKKEWSYPGWVMSDWGSAHSVDYASLGLDQQAGANFDKAIWFDTPLRQQVEAGILPRSRLSDMVRRVLRSLYAVDADPAPRETSIDYAAHAAVARAAARESIVLLKNDGILPLSNKSASVLVVGGHADIGVMSGGGSSQVTPIGGPAALIPVGGPGPIGVLARQLIVPSSPLKALQAALPNARVDFQSGYHPEAAAAAAKQADVVIVFVTQWQMEGYDAGSMILPDNQDRLIELVSSVNGNVIVVLETGNPVRMPWLGNVRAVLEAWYPGQEGGRAVADVIMGDVNPSARLPITFPKSESQNPRPEIPGRNEADSNAVTVTYSEGSDVGYRWFAKTGETPAFPFGHGLSYTRFTHGQLSLKRGAAITATFTITNSGDRAGADVPQLYLLEAGGRKTQRLAGFDKVWLGPGQTKKITITIDPRIIADWEDGGWQIAGGRYLFAVGHSAGKLGSASSINLKKRRWGPKQTER